MFAVNRITLPPRLSVFLGRGGTSGKPGVGRLRLDWLGTNASADRRCRGCRRRSEHLSDRCDRRCLRSGEQNVLGFADKIFLLVGQQTLQLALRDRHPTLGLCLSRQAGAGHAGRTGFAPSSAMLDLLRAGHGTLGFTARTSRPTRCKSRPRGALGGPAGIIHRDTRRNGAGPDRNDHRSPPATGPGSCVHPA
jgi:hypothetical protein